MPACDEPRPTLPRHPVQAARTRTHVRGRPPGEPHRVPLGAFSIFTTSTKSYTLLLFSPNDLVFVLFFVFWVFLL